MASAVRGFQVARREEVAASHRLLQATQAESSEDLPHLLRDEGEVAHHVVDLCSDLGQGAVLEPGRYSLVFHPPSPFFRRIELEVELEAGHYHVPLLVSPFSCASYRGS